MLEDFIRLVLEQDDAKSELVNQFANIPSSGLPSVGGTTTLYHFSFVKTDTFTLDPLRFGAGSYSRNEKNASSVPRTFFYVDPTEKEHHFGTSNLYVGQVPTSSIYDLTQDPNGLRDEIRKMNNGVMDTDRLLQRISGWRRGQWGSPDQGKWIKEEGVADGIFYETGHFRVVAMFVPVTVSRFQSEVG